MDPTKAPQHSRTWHQVGIAPLRREPNLEKAEEVVCMDVMGVRSDGAVISITITMFPSQFPEKSFDMLQGMHQQLMLAFGRLETYRNCDCFPAQKITCRTHDPANQAQTN